MLAGRFLGGHHALEAERLATFLTGDTDTDAHAGSALRAWFGMDPAARLLGQGRAALRGAIDRDIAAIDALIGRQLDAILHHARLRALEGSWRGLAWLIRGLDPTARIRVRLMTIAWPEICRDLDRAIEFDQSTMFRLIYENELGTPGGDPIGLLLIDHPVRHRPGPQAPTDDVAAIAALSAVAAAAFCVVVLAASPALLGVDEFGDLAMTADLAAPLRQASHARWRGLGNREDSRFVCVTVARALARPPWRNDPDRADGFRYAEYAPDAASRVWMSAVYPFAAVVARAQANHAWPADIRGVDTDREGGGVVTGLPVEWFRTDPPLSWPRLPLELVLTDGQERSLVDAGLIPLISLPYTADAAFASVASLHRPQRYAGPTAAAANANARLSAQINAILCASRFAHYIKVIGRDMTGKITTATQIEQRLQAWLRTYINAAIDAGPESRAQKPLVDGRVTVREYPGRPGVFGCTMHLKPHFQLDEVAAEFDLRADIADPRRAR
ncbi:type VI secretion system contractile sheath large subunit [Rhodopila sp.]|uniref:type VI secretion system contractile sheath large subunit n=1 Tax=Rhodopila sp. TaxID=2480087 RepID=UPI002BCE4349|nr:type VI secretion system contractile sheath large subunit [Rhodopila sp.]HVZ09634.1 type VI secretion system contractile sheath large subunit [Rhodopila sp.]